MLLEGRRAAYLLLTLFIRFIQEFKAESVRVCNSKNSNRRRRSLIYPNINLGKLSGIHLRHFSRRQLPPFLEGRGRGKVAVCLTFILDRKLDTGGWNEDLAGRECNPLTPFDKLAEFDSARDSIEMPK